MRNKCTQTISFASSVDCGTNDLTKSKMIATCIVVSKLNNNPIIKKDIQKNHGEKN